MDQADIHHGHFIDDDHIRVQRIFLVPLKMHALQPALAGIAVVFLINRRSARKFQKTVDRLRLVSRRLRHALRRTARRSSQKNVHVFLVEIVDDRVDGCRLTGSRTSGDDKETVTHSFHDRLLLKLVQLDLLRLRDLFQALFHVVLIDLRVEIQVMQHSRRIEFHIIELCRVNDPFPILFLHHQLLLHLEIHQMLFHMLRFYVQECRRIGKQLLLRQICMAVSRRLEQGVEKSAADPVIGIREDPDLRRDLVRYLKSHPLDIVRQLIRIFLDHRVHSRTVMLIDLHCKVHGDPVLLKEHHGLTHISFFLHLAADLHRHALADALDLGETFRLLLHDPEGVRLELLYDPFS